MLTGELLAIRGKSEGKDTCSLSLQRTPDASFAHILYRIQQQSDIQCRWRQYRQYKVRAPSRRFREFAYFTPGIWHRNSIQSTFQGHRNVSLCMFEKVQAEELGRLAFWVCPWRSGWAPVLFRAFRSKISLEKGFRCLLCRGLIRLVIFAKHYQKSVLST